MTDDDSQSLGDEIADELPDEPSTADHDSRLAGLADELRDAFVGVTVALLLTITRVLPFTMAFWRGLYKAGLKGIHKKSGADYVGFVNVGGKIKVVPVNWDYETNRFINSSGDWWKAPSEGEYRYSAAGGKVPAIWASASSNHVGSHLQAEVGEALDIGNSRHLYEAAEVQANIELNAQNLEQDGSGTALADGGLENIVVTGERPGPFADELVPLTTDADARVVSMNKYYQTYPEVVDTEEMKNQEVRGELKAANRDMEGLMIKVLLIAGAIVVGSLAAVFVLPELFGGGGGLIGGGGGGGDGGGSLPLMLRVAFGGL
jgi:hypothetical protein